MDLQGQRGRGEERGRALALDRPRCMASQGWGWGAYARILSVAQQVSISSWMHACTAILPLGTVYGVAEPLGWGVCPCCCRCLQVVLPDAKRSEDDIVVFLPDEHAAPDEDEARERGAVAALNRVQGGCG